MFSNLLQSFLKREFTNKGCFLGHIGGDDFIAVVDHHDIRSICESLIHDFDQIINDFYSSNHLSQHYVLAENRQGILEKIALVSLSIAIVTNKNRAFESVEELVEYAAVVKRKCKSVSGSCYLINI